MTFTITTSFHCSQWEPATHNSTPTKRRAPIGHADIQTGPSDPQYGVCGCDERRKISLTSYVNLLSHITTESKKLLGTSGRGLFHRTDDYQQILPHFYIREVFRLVLYHHQWSLFLLSLRVHRFPRARETRLHVSFSIYDVPPSSHRPCWVQYFRHSSPESFHCVRRLDIWIDALPCGVCNPSVWIGRWIRVSSTQISPFVWLFGSEFWIACSVHAVHVGTVQ